MAVNASPLNISDRASSVPVVKNKILSLFLEIPRRKKATRIAEGIPMKKNKE
jgi:hypothetical protein